MTIAGRRSIPNVRMSKDTHRRIHRAKAALTHYLGEDPQDRRSALVDLLADLRHWARFHKIEFASANQMASEHFDTEALFTVEERQAQHEGRQES